MLFSASDKAKLFTKKFFLRTRILITLVPCWKASLAIPVFKDVEERSIARNYCSVSLLSVVNKVFEKSVNNRLVDHLDICGLFSDFQHGFRSS